LDAIDAVQRVTGSEQTALMGACSGGIIAAMVAAHLAQTGQQDRIAALTLMVTVLDEARAGLAGAVIDKRTARLAAAASRARGYLDGRSLAEVFAWLRPNDLIWSYWVNNYLLGRKPPAFDILFWNADTTRMTAGLHRDFLQIGATNALVRPGGVTMLGLTGNPRPDRPSHLPGRRDHRPHLPVAGLLRVNPDAGRPPAVRAVDERARRRDGDPARKREGQLPGGQGVSGGSAGVGPGRADLPWLLVAGLR